MKAIVSILICGSALLVASTVLAADPLSQPLTRADCAKAGMRWNEGANVCAEPNATAAQPGSSNISISQPLTRGDCGKAGMHWNERANVCAELSEEGGLGLEPGKVGSGFAVVITIDKTKQKMMVSIDGKKLYEWRVSTGRRGYSTPSGTYTASSMNEVWYSKEWDNAPMPHSIFFTKDGHAIHGSYEVKTLGKPASHGCVRISPKNAATLYALVGKQGLKNTQVALTGVTPGGESKVASRTPRKPHVASRTGRKGSSQVRSGSNYAEIGPSWYGRRDRTQKRRGFFRPRVW